jgi:surface antigen
MRTLSLNFAIVAALLSTAGLLSIPAPAIAEPHATPRWGDIENDRDDRQRDASPRDERRYDSKRRYDDNRRYDGNRRYDNNRRWTAPPDRSWRYAPRYRYYGTPRYGYPHYYYYPRYRHYYRGDNFLGWLAFTAITLAIIDNLNERQQHEHEQSLHDALQAPVGETIRWKDADASGAVTVIREGTSSEGRYCREYSQAVKIGGESQQAYGTACRNPDGSWEILN